MDEEPGITLTIFDPGQQVSLTVSDHLTTSTLLIAEQTTEVSLSIAESQGGAVFISQDQDNRLIKGSDQGLYVRDDLTPDPLAYYILAKG